MKVLVDLNSKIHSFQITQQHKKRLCSEFPQHDFEFAQSYKHFKTLLADAEAALVWQFPQHLFEKSPKLRFLYTPAAGKDWVALDPRQKVKTRFSSFHGQLIAESFLAMLLYFNNRLDRASTLVNKRSWDRNFPGRRSLKGQKLLICGFGNIARHCAQTVMAFGMEVCGVRRNPQKNSDFEVIDVEQMDRRLSEFDHVLNLLPGDATSENFFDKKRLERMSSKAFFYNFGRGTTVCESSLIKALQNGHLPGAGLDVVRLEPLPADSPLWTQKNLLLTPHSSCCYDDYLDLFIDELLDCL